MTTKLNFLSKLVVLFLMFAATVLSQNITNTLGVGGRFKVKDATTDFFTLDQSNGTITLPLQLGSNQQGSIFKGADRFLHTFYGSGTDGQNTFLGINAGNFTMGGINSYEGSANTGVGYRSLYSNSTGYRNSAFGFQSLYYNTTGNENSAFGLNSLLFNQTGNGNSAFGRASLYSNTKGNNNTAIGFGALNSNDAGNNATAIGYYAMFYTNNTLAPFDNLNVAVGYEALRGSTTPASNTGNSNTAVGFQTLKNNSAGNDNSAFGSYSLLSNALGDDNSAYGYQSLYLSTSGDDNSAFGSYSLFSNTTGNGNSAFGRSSLYVNSTGYNNSAFGTNSLSFNSTGSNNTAVGYNAQVPSGSSSNQVRIGNTAVTYAGVQVAWTVTSDRRWKRNILPISLGLGFISKLNPVSYIRKNDESKKTEYGLIAQEVEEVLKQNGVESSGMLTITDKGMYELRYNDLIAPMIKAIQELKIENEKLKVEKDDEVAELKIKNHNLEERLAKYEEMQSLLVKELQ